MYRANPDPWNYQSSPYEAQKYAATLNALTRASYNTIIEPGCSIGVLSIQLAKRCNKLVAMDFSPLAIAQAQERLKPFAGATATVAKLPQDWPEGHYDLFVLSELIYYLAAPDIIALAHLVARDAALGAECVIVHYQGDAQTAISPNDARDLFCTTLGGLRSFRVTDHPSPADYNHCTLGFTHDTKA